MNEFLSQCLEEELPQDIYQQAFASQSTAMAEDDDKDQLETPDYPTIPSGSTDRSTATQPYSGMNPLCIAI